MNEVLDIQDKPGQKILGMPMKSFITLAILSGSIGLLIAFVAKNSYALFGGQC